MMTGDGWWMLAGVAALLAILSGLAEQRRSRRRDLDRPGWVPWTLLQILAALTAVLAIALALK
jgi:hypothetical protein